MLSKMVEPVKKPAIHNGQWREFKKYCSFPLILMVQQLSVCMNISTVFVYKSVVIIYRVLVGNSGDYHIFSFFVYKLLIITHSFVVYKSLIIAYVHFQMRIFTWLFTILMEFYYVLINRKQSSVTCQKFVVFTSQLQWITSMLSLVSKHFFFFKTTFQYRYSPRRVFFHYTSFYVSSSSQDNFGRSMHQTS